MKTKTITGICVALIAMAIGASSVWAAKEAPLETPLTEAGQKLQERYTGMLTELQAEISKVLPTVHEQKKAAYLKAREAEKAAATVPADLDHRLAKLAPVSSLNGVADAVELLAQTSEDCNKIRRGGRTAQR